MGIERLEKLCDRSLAEIGLRLTDLAMVSENRRSILRVSIDFADLNAAETEGADAQVDVLGREEHEMTTAIRVIDRSVEPRRVNVDLCARASRHLSAALDVDDSVSGAYVLEVSSPGVRRSVRRLQELKRFLGFALKVTRKQAVSGTRVVYGVHCGIVGTQSDAALRLELDGGADKAFLEIPISDISKATLNEDY